MVTEMNHCEKSALIQICESKEAIVRLSEDGSVLSWETIRMPEQSDLNAQLLQKWKVTGEKKLNCFF